MNFASQISRRLSARKPSALFSIPALAMAAALTLPALAQQPLLPYQDSSLPVEKRVDDLVSRMTLPEKVSQMQNTAIAIPRLGIPAYDWWNEGLHGVARSGYATVFPQAIGLAATWDTALLGQVATTISTEARAKYHDAIRHDNHSIYYGLTFWSPNINIFRDPRWGRGQETYGEDPYLTSRLGVAFVSGLQGTDPAYLKVVATPKHYAVHSGPESARHKFDVKVSPFDLEDTYLPAFRATVTEGHAGSVMCAYNSIDGEPACASKMLLQHYLRGAWKFKGYVTSDCGAIEDFYSKDGHHFSADAEHASVAAVRTGTDTTCGREYPALVQAVADGLIQESEIDTAVRNLFTARFRLGMFDPDAKVPYASIPLSENDTPRHRELSLDAARESIVLLKNQDSILPLKPGLKTIAVVGPNAAALAALEGNYNGMASAPVLPVDGISQVFGKGVKVLYAQGAPYAEPLSLPVPRTVFHPSAGSNAYGLSAEYFPNAAFTGSPALRRIDPQIDFDWSGASPAPALPMQTFSIRWQGTISAPAAGDIPFNLGLADCYPCAATEAVTIFLDGKQVFQTPSDETSSDRNTATRPFTLHFADTAPHAFRIDYAHSAKLFGAGLTLKWKPPVQPLLDQAVSIAGQADLVVAVVGLSPQLEGEEMAVHIDGFSGGDRTDIQLPAAQQHLLEAVAATGKPLVVVLMNGSALAVNWAQQHAAAILEAWYPGEAGGTAIAETLTGRNNPAGRLPVTFYASVDQLPAFDQYSMQGRTYRYFKGKPLYEFGYGLSYTTFAYSNLTLSSPALAAGDTLTVEADVKNSGPLPGDEVAELYLTVPAATGSPAPPFALKGFTRVHLDPGQTRHVRFELDPRRLSSVDVKGIRTAGPGTYTVYVGGRQPGAFSASLSTSFNVTGSITLPE